MSDRDLNINIRTTADTSGATQAAASLDRIRESGESISQTSGVMDQIADSLSRVKTVAEETGAAMKDGMGAEYEQALENANSKLDQYADALTAAGSRMKAAFNDNPGLTGFIDEVTNAVLTSEEFRKKLEQVDDVFEVLNNKMSDLDLGAKWGDDLDENLQQIIDGYNKEMDAADKAAEKAEAAEARKQQAAAATVERLEANNRRASATYEELQAELESYIAKLEEARKAGDNVAQADALKNIQDLGRRIKTAGDAGQLTSTQVKGLAGQITIAATRILGMSSALRGAIPFIHLFGTTIKTAMGPLGWAISTRLPGLSPPSLCTSFHRSLLSQAINFLFIRSSPPSASFLYPAPCPAGRSPRPAPWRSRQSGSRTAAPPAPGPTSAGRRRLLWPALPPVPPRRSAGSPEASRLGTSDNTPSSCTAPRGTPSFQHHLHLIFLQHLPNVRPGDVALGHAPGGVV